MRAGISAADKGGRPAPVDAHRSLRAESGAVRGELPGRSKSPLVKDAGLAWLEFEKPDLVRAERFFHDLDRHTGNDIDLATLRSLLKAAMSRAAGPEPAVPARRRRRHRHHRNPRSGPRPGHASQHRAEGVLMTSAEAPTAAHGNAASLSWPRYVDPTDLGEPYKLGFRILATRIELTDKLAENGYPIPLGDDWCGQQDGRITVHPAGTRRRVAAGHGQPSTDKYTIAWELK